MTAESRPTDTRPTESELTDDFGVLVGFDGSELAALAVRYGAAEAQRRNLTLTVVCVYQIPPMIYPNLASLPGEPEDSRAKAEAEKTLAEAVDLIRDHPGPKSFRTAPGNPAGTLVTLSANAEVVVLGARGRGGFIGRMLGSVSTALPSHSHCPTIIVPHRSTRSEEAPASVAVAVDGSDASRVAMFTAAAAAASRGTELELVSVLPTGDEWLYWYPELELSAEVSGRRQKQLTDALETEAGRLAAEFPDLGITTSVPVGDPAHALTELSARAGLMVLGTRGRGAVRSALLGSVSRAVLNRAEGPIMVVPS